MINAFKITAMYGISRVQKLIEIQLFSQVATNWVLSSCTGSEEPIQKTNNTQQLTNDS